jgi:uncharacterized membrane protein
MTGDSVHVVIAVFDTEAGAEAARKALKASRDEDLIGIRASIAVHKDEAGQIHYQDTGLTAGKGAVEGAVLGAVTGILTGGAGLALGAAGALAGGLIGKKKQGDSVADERLNRLAASLAPGASALAVVMDPGWGVVVEKELQQGMGAELFTADVPIEAGASQEAAYAALLSQLRHHDDPDRS